MPDFKEVEQTREPTLEEIHSAIDILRKSDPAVERYVQDPNSILHQYLAQTTTTAAQKLLKPIAVSDHLVVKENLSSEESQWLQEHYPRFEFEFKPLTNNAHGLLAASRKVETTVLLNSLRINKNSKFIDIGGDCLFYETRGFKNYHCDAPLLDIKDHQRCLNRIQNLKDSGNPLHSILSKLYNQNNDYKIHDRVCVHKAQDCTFRAEKAVAVHSLYDISLEDLHITMTKRGINTLSAVMMYDTAIAYSKQGRNDVYKYYWNLDASNKNITFSFENDSSHTYTHDLKTYLSWFTTHQHFGKHDVMLIELLENVGGMQYLKICLIPHAQVSSSISHRMWFDTADMDCVKVFEYDYNYPNTSNLNSFDLKTYFGKDWVSLDTVFRKWPLKTKNVFLPHDFVKMVKKFVWASTETKFTPLEIFKITRSVASTFIVGKTIVPKYGHLSDEDLWYFVHTVYIYVWEKKYRSGRAMQSMMHDLEQNRKTFEKGIFSKLFSPFTKTYKLSTRFFFTAPMHNSLVPWICSVFDVDSLITPAINCVEFTDHSLILHRRGEMVEEQYFHGIAKRTLMHLSLLCDRLSHIFDTEPRTLDSVLLEHVPLARKVNSMDDKEYGFIRAISPLFPPKVDKYNNSYRKIEDMFENCFFEMKLLKFNPTTYFDLCAAPGGFYKYVKGRFNTITESYFHSYRRGISMWHEYTNEEFNTCDGDLTDKAELRSLLKQLKTSKISKKVDLVTADGCVGIDEGDKETLNFELIQSEHVLAYELLAERGSFLVKVFGMTKSSTLNLINRFSTLFEHTLVYSSPYSPPFSTEFYVLYYNRLPKKFTDKIHVGINSLGTIYHMFDSHKETLKPTLTLVRNDKYKIINSNLRKFTNKDTKDYRPVIAADCPRSIGAKWENDLYNLMKSHYVEYAQAMSYVLLNLMYLNNYSLKNAFGKAVRYFKSSAYEDTQALYERGIYCFCVLVNKIEDLFEINKRTVQYDSSSSVSSESLNLLDSHTVVPDIMEAFSDPQYSMPRDFWRAYDAARSLASSPQLLGTASVECAELFGVALDRGDLKRLRDYYSHFGMLYLETVETAASNLGKSSETCMQDFLSTMEDFNVYDNLLSDTILENFDRFISCVREGTRFNLSVTPIFSQDIIVEMQANATVDSGVDSEIQETSTDSADDYNDKIVPDYDEHNTIEENIETEVYPSTSNDHVFLCTVDVHEPPTTSTDSKNYSDPSTSAADSVTTSETVTSSTLRDASTPPPKNSIDIINPVLNTLDNENLDETIPVDADGTCIFAAISGLNGATFREQLKNIFSHFKDDEIQQQLEGKTLGNKHLLSLLTSIFQVKFLIVKPEGEICIGDVTDKECRLKLENNHIERYKSCSVTTTFERHDACIEYMNNEYNLLFNLLYYTGSEDECLVVGNVLLLPQIFSDSRNFNRKLKALDLCAVYFLIEKAYMVFLIGKGYCELHFSDGQTTFVGGKHCVEKGRLICSASCLVKPKPLKTAINWDCLIVLADSDKSQGKTIRINVLKSNYVDPKAILDKMTETFRIFPKTVCIMIKLVCDPYPLIKALTECCSSLYLHVEYPIRESHLRVPDNKDNEFNIRNAIFEQLELWRTHSYYVKQEFQSYLLNSISTNDSDIESLTTVNRPDIAICNITVTKEKIVNLSWYRSALDRKQNYMVAYYQNTRNCEQNGFYNFNSANSAQGDSTFLETSFPNNLKVNGKISLKNGTYYLCFSRKTEVWLADALYSRNRFTLYSPKLFELEVQEGCPGVGKTQYTIENHKFGKDVILTTTTAAKFDLRKRVKERHGEDATDLEINRRYNSLTGFLMNYDNFSVDTMYVDEALMSHFGSILMAAKRANCSKLVIIGDSAQIPYFDRNGAVTKYHSFKILPPEKYTVKYKTISRRCPLDVVYQLNRLCTEDKKPCYTQKLTTTNAKQQTMRTTMIESLLSVPYHSSYSYLTFNQNDKALVRQHFARNNLKVETITEFQGQTAANVILVRLEQKNIEPFDQIPQIVVAISRHTNSFHYYTTKSDVLTEIIKTSNSVPAFCLKQLLEKVEAGGQLPFFEYQQTPPTIGTTLTERKIFRDFVYQNHFSGVMSMQPELLEVPLFERTVNFCDLEKFHKVEDPLNVMQFIADQIVKGSTLTWDTNVANKYNALIFESAPGHLLSNVDFIFKDKFYLPRFRDYLTSSLRTPCPRAVVPSVHSTLKAFIERNGDVPQLHGENDTYCYVDGMISSVFSDTFHMDRIEGYKRHPIEVSVPALEEWKQGQPGAIMSQLETYFNIHEIPNKDYYEYILKRIPKPNLEESGHLKFPAPQAIAYQNKQINAYFCTIGKQIKSRLIAALKLNHVFYTDMSTEEFVDILNQRLPPAMQNQYYSETLEIDMSKYDKSQSHLALLCDVSIFIMMGAPSEFITLYVLMHAFTKLSSLTTGIQAFVSYQRKSGDFFTLGGNTFYSFVSVLYSLKTSGYDLSDVFGMWSGDDSLLFLRHSLPNTSTILNQLSHVFNLEAKIFKYDCYYFCSKFLVHDGYGWCVFPDPWKLLIKIGRNDLVDYEHVEQYRISLVDITSSLRNINHHGVLNKHFRARYKFNYDIDLLLYSIYYFVRDKELFHSNYYVDDGDVLTYTNIRPDLDI